MSLISVDEALRRVLASIERIARAEAAASGATVEPEVKIGHGAPPLVNEPAAVARTHPALAAVAPVVEPGPVTASEDVGLFAAEDVPCVYWLLGGADPAAFAGATTPAELMARVAAQPSNHSPYYAPVVEPTLSIGVAALVAAARRWLPAEA